MEGVLLVSDLAGNWLGTDVYLFICLLVFSLNSFYLVTASQIHIAVKNYGIFLFFGFSPDMVK